MDLHVTGVSRQSALTMTVEADSKQCRLAISEKRALSAYLACSSKALCDLVHTKHLKGNVLFFERRSCLYLLTPDVVERMNGKVNTRNSKYTFHY